MTSLASDVVGWAGAAMLLIAYALLTRGRIRATSSLYLTLNLIGSAGLATNAAFHAAWPSTVVNVLWLAIGLTALRKPADGARAERSPEPATSTSEGG